MRGASWRYSGDGAHLAGQEADAYRFGHYASRRDRGHARDALMQAARWRGLRHLLGGKHPGCTERRDPRKMDWIEPSVCEFDGRLSLAFFRGEFVLYARANPAAHGQRFVQYARSPDLITWGAFKTIELLGYDYPQGDIYFFAAQVNPVHPSSMIALFPVVHRYRGCIAMAVSHDGDRWSSPISLSQCGVFGDRTQDHPVAGMVHLTESGQVMLYIHRNVPFVQVDMFTPWKLQQLMLKEFPRAKVDWFSIPEAALLELTLQKLRELNVTS